MGLWRLFYLGEIETKTEYSWATYTRLSDGAYNKLKKYNQRDIFGDTDNRTVLEAEDDAATANWGDKWRMPTLEEFVELSTLNNEWGTMNDSDGEEIYGSYFYESGKSKDDEDAKYIFIPAAGLWSATSLNYPGSVGYYWSSSHYALYPYTAWRFGFSKDSVTPDNRSNRFIGHSVRPVISKSAVDN